MNKKTTLMTGFIFVLAVACCMNAYAAAGGDGPSWTGFWNGVGGFFYNAMPWNWGNWWGK